MDDITLEEMVMMEDGHLTAKKLAEEAIKYCSAEEMKSYLRHCYGILAGRVLFVF